MCHRHTNVTVHFARNSVIVASVELKSVLVILSSTKINSIFGQNMEVNFKMLSHTKQKRFFEMIVPNCRNPPVERGHPFVKGIQASMKLECCKLFPTITFEYKLPTQMNCNVVYSTENYACSYISMPAAT